MHDIPLLYCHIQVGKANIGPESEIEIQISENLFPRKGKFPQSAKLNSRENFMPQGNYIVLCVLSLPQKQRLQ